MDKNTLYNLVFAKTMLPFVDKNLANKLTPIIDKVANINTLDKKVDNNVIGSADKKLISMLISAAKTANR